MSFWIHHSRRFSTSNRRQELNRAFRNPFGVVTASFRVNNCMMLLVLSTFFSLYRDTYLKKNNEYDVSWKVRCLCFKNLRSCASSIRFEFDSVRFRRVCFVFRHTDFRQSHDKIVFVGKHSWCFTSSNVWLKKEMSDMLRFARFVVTHTLCWIMLMMFHGRWDA